MSEEQLQQLFKAFSQADTSATRRFGGAELGLIISQKLVQMMGKQLMFRANPAKEVCSVFRYVLRHKTS